MNKRLAMVVMAAAADHRDYDGPIKSTKASKSVKKATTAAEKKDVAKKERTKSGV